MKLKKLKFVFEKGMEETDRRKWTRYERSGSEERVKGRQGKKDIKDESVRNGVIKKKKDILWQ